MGPQALSLFPFDSFTFIVLNIALKALDLIGKYSTTELFILFFKIIDFYTVCAFAVTRGVQRSVGSLKLEIQVVESYPMLVVRAKRKSYTRAM